MLKTFEKFFLVNSILLLIIISILATTGCGKNKRKRRRAVPPLVAEKITVTGRIIDSATQLLINNTSVTISFQGDLKDNVVNSGLANDPITELTTTEGLATFAIRDVTLPANIKIVAQAKDYISSSHSLNILEDGNFEFNFPLVKRNSTTLGTNTKEQNLSLSTTGAITEAIELATEKDDTTTSNANLAIAKDTILTDQNGDPLNGVVSVSITYFNNISNSSLKTLPNGFSIDKQMTESINEDDLAKILPNSNSQTGVFISAGFTAIEIRDNQGNIAKSFDQDISITIGISKDMINPQTETKVQNGDLIPIWTHDHTTGQWSYHDLGIIEGPNEDGNFFVTFQTNHLSWYNLAWYAASCNVKIIIPPGVDPEINLMIDVVGSGFFESRRVSTDRNINFSNTPQNMPLTFTAWHNGPTQGEFLVEATKTVTDACIETPITLDAIDPASFDFGSLLITAEELYGLCNSNQIRPIPSANIYVNKLDTAQWTPGTTDINGEVTINGLFGGETKVYIYDMRKFRWRTQLVTVVPSTTTNVLFQLDARTITSGATGGSFTGATGDEINPYCS